MLAAKCFEARVAIVSFRRGSESEGENQVVARWRSLSQRRQDSAEFVVFQ
jgi:DnaJ-domain-containing protein 1